MKFIGIFQFQINLDFFIFGSIFPQKVLKKKLLETYRKFENETFWKCAAIVFVIRSVLKSLCIKLETDA